MKRICAICGDTINIDENNSVRAIQYKKKFYHFDLLSLALFVSAVAAAQVPSVTVENSKGESFDTSVLLEEGTPMIISFWSTSCKPCIRELDAVYESLPDWLDEVDFRVVAVSTDDNRLLAKAKSFAEGRGWGEDFTLLFDKNQDFMSSISRMRTV